MRTEMRDDEIHATSGAHIYVVFCWSCYGVSGRAVMVVEATGMCVRYANECLQYAVQTHALK